MVLVFGLGGFGISTQGFSSESPKTEMKEWTFLTFINGNNNLDKYGAEDINEMEKVGSQDHLNIVVQWASYEAKTAKRLLVIKDNDTKKVTSPILEDLGKVDMGDHKVLSQFIAWGVKNFPAKKYFINVWNHGNGWQKKFSENGEITPNDISYDDFTGNKITTEQLGAVLRETEAIIGHKVDIYGSDACLMNMAEVAGEFSNSVQVMVGSEETEPLDGWPYDDFLARWKPEMTGAEVGTALTETYVASYSGGSQGTDQVTFSALNLEAFGSFAKAVSVVGSKIQALDATVVPAVKSAFQSTIDFTYGDYSDVGDFVANLLKVPALSNEPSLGELKTTVSKLVIANKGTRRYARATGISFWLPNSASRYDQFIKRYSGFQFQKDTLWADALKRVLK